MSATPVGFTASAIVSTKPVSLTGFSWTGFTAVKLYSGTDNTGTLVALGGAAATIPFSCVLEFPNGLFVEVTGSGKGSVWVE
jgi:hypothetical protein